MSFHPAMIHVPDIASRALALILLGWCATAAGQRSEERWSQTLPSGSEVQFRLLRAAQAAAPLPAIVLLGGFERGAAALDLLPADESVVLAGFDYPLEIPRRAGWRDIPRLVPEVERGIADTRLALRRLHEDLSRHPFVDPERISLIGVSLGAPFALLAAGDSPYAGLVLVHGFADVRRTTQWQLQRRWQDRYGRFGEVAAWAAARLLTWLIDFPDPRAAVSELREGQRVLLITATDDEFVPREVSEELVAALQASSAELTLRRTRGGHVRGSNEQVIRALFALGEPWLRRHRLL